MCYVGASASAEMHREPPGWRCGEPGRCSALRGWPAWLLLVRGGGLSAHWHCRGSCKAPWQAGKGGRWRLKVAVRALPVAPPGAAAQQVRWVPRVHSGAGFLPAGLEPAAATGCGETLEMQRCPRNLCGGFWPGLHGSFPPQKPTDEVGSCLESTLVLSGSTEPKAGLCRGPSPQPDLFPSFSLHPAHVRQGLLSSEVPLNEGIGDCSSTQPEMKDVWSPVTSQPHTRERGAAVKSWPVPASARGLATQRPPSSHLSRRAFILSALDLESGFDR